MAYPLIGQFNAISIQTKKPLAVKLHNIQGLWDEGSTQETWKAYTGKNPLGNITSSITKEGLYIEGLSTSTAHGQAKYVGTGLMDAAMERAFLTQNQGYIRLWATGKEVIHPAPFYSKLGFKAKFSPGNQESIKAQQALNQYNATSNKPFQYPTGISMESSEGLGTEALKQRDKGIKKGLSPHQIMENILETAPKGTKAYTMNRVRKGHSILNEVKTAQKTGNLIVGHPNLTPLSSYASIKPKPNAQIWD
ncbi:MAG: hypothetical protein ACKO37_01865 [Vampirovibrionales bacterium]